MQNHRKILVQGLVRAAEGKAVEVDGRPALPLLICLVSQILEVNACGCDLVQQSLYSLSVRFPFIQEDDVLLGLHDLNVALELHREQVVRIQHDELLALLVAEQAPVCWVANHAEPEHPVAVGGLVLGQEVVLPIAGQEGIADDPDSEISLLKYMLLFKDTEVNGRVLGHLRGLDC